MKKLYGTLDQHLGHFRRYSPEELGAKITEAGFHLETLRFLNRAAVPGWWLNSRVLKRRVMPKGQLKFFKWIMPILKLELKRPPSFGLSLLALATKRRNDECASCHRVVPTDVRRPENTAVCGVACAPHYPGFSPPWCCCP